jgi:hypothetical protein
MAVSSGRGYQASSGHGYGTSYLKTNGNETLSTVNALHRNTDQLNGPTLPTWASRQVGGFLKYRP